MGAFLTESDKKAIVNQRWAWIMDKIQAELAEVERRYPRSDRVALLRAMLAAASERDEVRMLEQAMLYVRNRRILPPGIYASCPPPGKTVYLDGERLEPGRKLSTLCLGVIHAQIYR